MDVQGEWPPAGQPGLICTFHWGAGMWGLRHARASGLKAHALVAPLAGAHFGGRRVLLAYARARTAEVARALGCPALETSVSLRPVLQALRRGEQVLAAIDVPADQVSASEEIGLLGMRARVPRGLLRLAVDERLPVTVYLTGLNVGTGRRLLRIHPLGVYEDLGQLMQDVFAFLDQAIREDPPAWHFWGEAGRIFVRH
jgi:lauroyl/myristoyl acyltransferase